MHRIFYKLCICMQRRLAILLFVLPLVGFAQNHTPKCGAEALFRAIKQHNPAFTLSSFVSPVAKQTASQSELTIAVILHIVLNQDQVNELGGKAGIRKRVNSQLEIINRDFSAQNDQSSLPADFAALAGNAHLRFALARRDIDGFPTEGFQVQYTRKEGFYFHGIEGSGIAFSDAKYFKGDGDQAWDPTSYLNIWVVSLPVDNGEEAILGLTIPPSYVGAHTGIPINEQGIILNYKAFGLQEDSDDVFITGATGGRTLTHELGHYFGLRHIWGDDNGLCADNGGEDDGIEDTPPQGSPNYSCVEYPYYDDCSYEGDGIMFMNFMDYTPDDCVALFTMGQTGYMRSELSVDGPSYSLTQHPHLLESPDNDYDNSFSIWPNPSVENINIHFEQPPQNLQGIYIIDALGRTVGIVSDYRSQGSYVFNTTLLANGIYFVHAVFNNFVECKPVVVTAVK